MVNFETLKVIYYGYMFTRTWDMRWCFGETQWPVTKAFKLKKRMVCIMFELDHKQSCKPLSLIIYCLHWLLSTIMKHSVFMLKPQNNSTRLKISTPTVGWLTVSDRCQVLSFWNWSLLFSSLTCNKLPQQWKFIILNMNLTFPCYFLINHSYYSTEEFLNK